MNTKITFNYTNKYDDGIPNNNFPEETQHIITDGVFDFEDWLINSNIYFEKDDKTDGFYWVIDPETEERTGEAYFVLREEPTSEDLCG